MSDPDKDGAPFYFAMRRPPTAAAIDEDIYLTVTAGIPTDPCGVESIEIILSISFAVHVIAQLTHAVEAALRNDR